MSDDAQKFIKGLKYNAWEYFSKSLKDLAKIKQINHQNSRLAKNYQNFRYISAQAPQEVNGDLEQLRVFCNERFKRKTKLIDSLLSTSTILVLISIFLVFVGIGLLLLPLFIISSFCLTKQSKKYHALSNYIYRYSLSKKIVSMLNRDLKEDSVLNIFIDFNPPFKRDKKLNTKKHPTRQKCKITNYQDSWFDLRGEFSDHTKFKLNIAEYYRNTAGWKRTRSGKKKWKSKYKFKKMEISLMLIYPSKKYGAVAILEKEAIDAIKLAKTAKLKAFKINSRSILLKVSLPQKSPTLTYQTVTSMFLSLYQILNLARTLSKVSK